MKAFNRTILELKRWYPGLPVQKGHSFNRTKLELKFGIKCYHRVFVLPLLIAPNWN